MEHFQRTRNKPSLSISSLYHPGGKLPRVGLRSSLNSSAMLRAMLISIQLGVSCSSWHNQLTITLDSVAQELCPRAAYIRHPEPQRKEIWKKLLALMTWPHWNESISFTTTAPKSTVLVWRATLALLSVLGFVTGCVWMFVLCPEVHMLTSEATRWWHKEARLLEGIKWWL